MELKPEDVLALYKTFRKSVGGDQAAATLTLATVMQDNMKAFVSVSVANKDGEISGGLNSKPKF